MPNISVPKGHTGLPGYRHSHSPALAAERSARAPTDDSQSQLQELFQLQCDSARRHADWEALEYRMQCLLEQLAGVPPYCGAVSRGLAPPRVASDERWWLELGPVDSARELITLERDGSMLAALSPTDGGRLRLTAYRPLDGHSLERLLYLAAHPHPRFGVHMRVNNWQLAVDEAADADNFFASEQGDSYFAHWPGGLGGEGEFGGQTALAGQLVEMQLRVYQHFSQPG
ncbi:hypothetical protein [Parahaliea aestuarii]|uniref:Uncharacterized protein n=1 Tax=Parahaliea aestuarii TaxID=1852021 RepID=A0A5C8ZXG2_9GAMM|nr:hypothetical protein [Parahaliea aestuarii]TXS93263.1 hypothetical protein FVW59_05325 [Parahaliea aestuarii]